MPLVDLHYPEGCIDDARIARIAGRIAAAAREAEGLPDTPAARAISVVNCNACRHVFVDGKRCETARFQVVVHAFADALDDAAKRRLVARVTAAFVEECPDCSDGRNVWCLIDALAPGSFAAAGTLIDFARVRAMTGADPL